MKRSFLRTSILSVFFVMFLGSPAFAYSLADINTGDNVNVSDRVGFGSTPGGEFNLDIHTGVGTISLTSLCLEYNEHIDYSNTFKVQNVANYAQADGSPNDPLEVETEWVFWNYLQGTFGERNDALANAVQNVVWVLEGERALSQIGVAAQTFYTTHITNNDVGFGISGGIVKVLNLEYADGRSAQSQLIAAPVPEPATMLLFGAGLIGLTGVVRRRNKKG